MGCATGTPCCDCGGGCSDACIDNWNGCLPDSIGAGLLYHIKDYPGANLAEQVQNALVDVYANCGWMQTGFRLNTNLVPKISGSGGDFTAAGTADLDGRLSRPFTLDYRTNRTLVLEYDSTVEPESPKSLAFAWEIAFRGLTESVDGTGPLILRHLPASAANPGSSPRVIHPITNAEHIVAETTTFTITITIGETPVVSYPSYESTYFDGAEFVDITGCAEQLPVTYDVEADGVLLYSISYDQDFMGKRCLATVGFDIHHRESFSAYTLKTENLTVTL